MDGYFRVKNKGLTFAAIFVAAFFFFEGSVLLAQVTSGTIFGTVKDPSGALVSGAVVTITNPSNGLARTVTTSGAGEFVAPGLLPGTYNITVEAEGFKKLKSSGFVLGAADKLSAGDLVLAVGTVTAQVTVTADSGQIQLQSNSGERSDVITDKQLNDVAMNGRNVLDYMKLIPGVTSAFNGAVSGTGGIDAFNINGTRANEHEFTIDGASNVDTGNNGGTHVTINPDAIDEVKVLTSNYAAEFGKAAGGQVAITTKSGTNHWHGDARFFHRNESLNANEWFNKKNELQGGSPNTPALYRYNYVGYQIGGPIRKNKLFVFWSQEFYRQLIPIGGTAQFYTPTALERQGDFSQSVVPDSNSNNPPDPVVIAGPGITNNVIPSSQINPQMQKILNLFPLPNVSGFGVNGQNYNFSEALSGRAPRREDILRVDFQINSSNRLYGRWIHNSEDDTSPYVPFPGPFGIFACSSGVTFPGGCTQKHPGWNFSANLVSTITPTLLNEFSVGPSHTLSIAEAVNGNITRATNGITLPLLFPLSPDQSIPDMSFNFNGPNVNLPGGYLGATPWHQANTTINVNDNLTWVRNNHTFKTGLFYQRSRKDQIAWGNLNGQFSFSTAPTSGGTCPAGVACTLGDPFASALLGNFDSFDQSTARPLGKFRYNQFEFYLQDTWKALSRLTLDYGMRFVWIPPQYDANNQVALFNPSAYNPAKAVTIDPGTGNIITADGGDLLNGMQYTKENQIPMGGWNSRGIMPEPRVGFAYDVFGSHKTILRGGFGMTHDRTQGNLIFNTVFNNPALVQTPSVSANNVVNLPTLSTSASEVPVQSSGNILGAARDGKVPTVYSFSFGVQHEIGSGTTLDLAYVGTASRHLVTSRDINAMPYGEAFTRAAQNPNCVDNNGNPVFPGGVVPSVQPGLQPQYAAAGYDFNGFCAYGFNSFTSNYLVPYKGYGQIPYLEFNGTSNYNSLQASLQRRFSKGLTFGAVYTWSKALTTANTDQDTQDPFNALLDYRAASWDRTHVFAANYVYDLPNLTKHFGGPKWLAYITDHYELSGVTQFMTGTPVDLNSAFSFPPGSLTGSDQYGAIPFYYSLDKSGNLVLPRVGAPGRGSRDTLRSGGMQNWDMSLLKNIPLGQNEARYLQLRLEAFNAFNHPNFNNKYYTPTVTGPWAYATPTTPLTITKNANWGTYADTYSGSGGFRVVQLAAKIYF
ncbi:MAG TPA: carboxypeptidase regulatory-like domain-containing protein [Terriglobales bacterium]|nr:carboxypeptidase regulatory-like domain-containing protein [Terriglobales bacterium]